MGDSPDHARRRLESEFLLALRRSGAVMQLLGAASAERIGINVTDLNCLNILALRGQLTAGELARATGLTTASITGVLDRLEEAGFVRRERDAHDRRRVVVHLDATRGLRDVPSRWSATRPSTAVDRCALPGHDLVPARHPARCGRCRRPGRRDVKGSKPVIERTVAFASARRPWPVLGPLAYSFSAC